VDECSPSMPQGLDHQSAAALGAQMRQTGGQRTRLARSIARRVRMSDAEGNSSGQRRWALS